MRVTIETKDGLVERDEYFSTIVLTHDYFDPTGKRLHMLHCPECGDKMGQYTGCIYAIVPTNIPMGLPYIQQCSRCKRKWRIGHISFPSV